MKTFRLLISAFMLLACSSFAWASSITGSVTIAGNDTYNSSGITFNPTTGAVVQASGTMSSFAPVMVGGLMQDYVANLTSFQFNAATGVTLFSVTNATGTLTFTITNLITHVIDANGTLTLAGSGYLNETGYSQTNGTFSLTSSTAGLITGFQLNSNDVAVTPEPSSLLLLGTGLVGTAGTLIRRRRSSMAV